MKEYMKNKNFIPERFYNKIEFKKNKKENIILSAFLIFNLLLIPKTVEYLCKVKEESSISKENIIKQNKVDLDDINIWVENIINDNIEEAYINNKTGDIVVNDLSKIDDLSSNKLIKVESVNLTDNEKYKLGVSLNE